MKKFLYGFGYAFKGLNYAFKTQLNFKVHAVAAVLIILAGVYFQLSLREWLWIILAIGLVMLTELLNTAIEVLVDFISPGYHLQAGIIKDVAAAAVLATAVIAVLIGLIIFVPKFI